jgi:hypothetical protein
MIIQVVEPARRLRTNPQRRGFPTYANSCRTSCAPDCHPCRCHLKDNSYSYNYTAMNIDSQHLQLLHSSIMLICCLLFLSFSWEPVQHQVQKCPVNIGYTIISAPPKMTVIVSMLTLIGSQNSGGPAHWALGLPPHLELQETSIISSISICNTMSNVNAPDTEHVPTG